MAAKKPKGGGGKDKQQKKSKPAYKLATVYEVADGALKRRTKTCPKCGVFLAAHKDRYACGKCGYMERR